MHINCLNGISGNPPEADKSAPTDDRIDSLISINGHILGLKEREIKSERCRATRSFIELGIYKSYSEEYLKVNG